MSAENGFAITLFQAIGWVFFALAGLSATIVGRNAVLEYRLRWLPRAPGVMESCNPVLVHTASGTSTGVHSAPKWIVDAKFSYSIGGVHYEGTRLSNILPEKIVASSEYSLTEPPNSIAAVCRRYSPGTEIQVFYDPSNPKFGFVYFASPIKRWPWVIPPVLAFLVGSFFFYLARFARLH